MSIHEQRQTPEEQTTDDRQPLFEVAQPVSMDNLMPTWLPRRFAEELLDEHEHPWDLEEFRLAECYNRHSDEGLKILLVGPNGTRLFIGEDTTARDSNGLFGYLIRPDDRLPLVRTTREALDLLKPAQAAAAEMDDATPLRQGEWFLVPTDDEPVSQSFSGGVSERPFGGSPLENHVPTWYGLGVTAEQFMERFDALCPVLAGHVTSPAGAFETVAKGYRIAEVEDVELQTDPPTFGELREAAEPIYVRGTLRHRENDHYMERLGEQWHLAVTHDVDVFTIDTDALQESRPAVRYD